MWRFCDSVLAVLSVLLELLVLTFAVVLTVGHTGTAMQGAATTAMADSATTAKSANSLLLVSVTRSVPGGQNLWF